MTKYLLLTLLTILPISGAYAHCQIPCGIYDDARVFDELEEHIDTIERSMKGIAESNNPHDVARWTMNKEEHARKIQDIAAQYFMTQRLEINGPNYVQSLMRIHQLSLLSMKAKQSMDLTVPRDLKKVLAGYEKLYFKPHKHDNDHDHDHE